MIRFLHKRQTYQFIIESQFKEFLDFINDYDQNLLFKRDNRYILVDYHDSVRLGMSIMEDFREVDFWVEVKSDVPFFADSCESISWKQYMTEVGECGLDDYFDLLLQFHITVEYKNWW